MSLKGTITAMITPFKDEKVDEEGLAYNIKMQIANGVAGLLVLGTTGEAPTLSADEQSQIISLAVQVANKQVPIWAGTGSYCTRQTIEKTKRAKELGANIALIVSPFYNNPTQEGIYRHFEAVAHSVEIPIVIYNIPGRCGINIELSTLLRIAELPNIVGLKEASGNIMQASTILHVFKERFPLFSVFSGDDAFTLPMMALGATGVISVVSNLLPSQIVALTQSLLEKDWDQANQLHFQLLPLFKAAFIETNPIPIKKAMELCGLPSGGCRLPLCEMKTENLKLLSDVLQKIEFIHG